MTKTWTEERSGKAQSLWSDASLTPQFIADKCGVSYQALQSHTHRNRDRFPKRGQPNAGTAKPKVKAEPKPQYRRYTDIEQIEIAAKLWSTRVGIGAIIKKMRMSDKTFMKMRQYSPSHFPKRDKHNRIAFELPDGAPRSKAKIPAKGQGVHLKNCEGWLHLSGESITSDRSYIWRGTYSQAERMMELSQFQLTPIAEG